MTKNRTTECMLQTVLGRFKYPGSGAMVTGLIVGGYYSSNSQYSQMEYEATQAAYRYVYYDSLTDNYVLSDYHTRSLGTKSKEIVKYHKVKDNEYYRPVNAPMALACADLKGMNGNNENDSVLFGAEVYAFSLEDGGITGSEIGSMSICTDQRNQGNDKKKKDQVWIGDVPGLAVSIRMPRGTITDRVLYALWECTERRNSMIKMIITGWT